MRGSHGCRRSMLDREKKPFDRRLFTELEGGGDRQTDEEDVAECDIELVELRILHERQESVVDFDPFFSEDRLDLKT